MTIEWLKFVISPELREKFIEKDAQIWTSKLASYPGFLGKEVWLNPDRPNEVIMVIHWESREKWKSIPIQDLVETEREFNRQMGADSYKMLESLEYQVRRYPLPPFP
jgi:uncharacterized protein (TIGR03792 family)